MAEPRIIETGVSVSVGGKIQVKKYEISSDYYFNQSAKWSIPDDWTDEQAQKFRAGQTADLKQAVEAFAQQEVEALFNQRKELNT